MTTIIRLTQQITGIRLARADAMQAGLIAAWMLAMIALPILNWTFGSRLIPQAVTGALLIQFAAVMTITASVWGGSRTLIGFTLIGIMTWSMEALGSKTGFPFGSYEYTGALQPQIAGVPLLIPVAWFTMLAASWAVADAILPRWRARVYGPAAFVLISAAAMTAWDLFLDPQMVGWGFWVWEQPGGYFGIPWVNFAGWLLTAMIATAAALPLIRPEARHVRRPPLIVIYGVTWVLETFGLALFWDQPGPALVGGVAMGSLLALALRGGWKDARG
jgi:putative membrane protein